MRMLQERQEKIGMALQNHGRVCAMSHFHSAREAKEFLVSQIVDEAQRENIVLSEPERQDALLFGICVDLPGDANRR